MGILRWSWRNIAMGSKACVLLLIANNALAAPTVQGIGGKLDHKASVTISGSGFGSKSKAAPLVWDDASGTNILDKWSGYWPNKLGQYDVAYRTPIRGINPPHNRVGRYIAGAHADNKGYDAGYNVIVWKNIDSPKYIYASWYQRADEQWVTRDDNNYKTFAYSRCCSPYEMPNNWYLNYGTPVTYQLGTNPQHQLNDDGSSLVFPDLNNKGRYWGTAVNPFHNWSKMEVAIHVTSSSDGYITFWENGKKVVDYRGSTDKYPGTSRSIGIGGFARAYSTQDWRYFADLYFDSSLARIVLANDQSLAKATVVENQIPTAWSDSSITATVNLGKFSNGQTAYLFVVDASGAVNSTGLPVTVGGTSVVKTPSAPGNFSVSK